MPIDLIAAAVFLFGFWRGYNQGIISTVFNVLAYLFGLVFAFKMTPTATRILEQVFNSDNPMMFIAAFVVNVVFIMFVMRQAGKGFSNFLQTMHLNMINQAIGGTVMGLFFVLILSVLVWFANAAGMIAEQTRLESRALPHLLEMPVRAKGLAERIKPFVLDAWDTSVKWMDRVEDYGEEKAGVGAGGDQPRIYRVPESGSAPRIEGTPSETRSKNRAIYEDTGSGIED